ncbi:MAG: hypothetical protein IJ242_12965 [Clostridia bacterium]|nr:hypothetical protein [Clostridia bacterium]
MSFVENKLCETMGKILNQEKYEVNDNFISKGGNSFLAQKLADECGINGLTPQIVMMGLTPKHISEVLNEKGGRKPAFTVGEATAEEYPMTPSMLYNFFRCEATGDTIDIMDLKALWELNDDVDIERLRQALIKTISHYEGLNIGFCRERAVFIKRKAEIPEIPVMELTKDGLKDFLLKAGSKKRNLADDNMIDVTIIKFNGKSYLYLRMPHLVYDGMSTSNFLKDISICYDGGEPIEEQSTIFDSGNYQKIISETGFYDEALDYYDHIFREYPSDLRKDMKDDYSTYFFNENIGQISGANAKAFLKENGLTFGTVLQAAFIVALSKALKKDKLVYRIFHSGRYDDRVNNMQGTEARPVLMLVDINPEHQVLDFLHHLQYRYFETVYYDVVPFTELIKRYPDIDSGIIFNYRGSLLGNTDIVLDGKPNSFSVLGYIYGSDSKDAAHSHDIVDMMIDKTPNGFTMSGNSGYFSKEKVLEIMDNTKKIYNLFMEKETMKQVLEALDNQIQD